MVVSISRCRNVSVLLLFCGIGLSSLSWKLQDPGSLLPKVAHHNVFLLGRKSFFRLSICDAFPMHWEEHFTGWSRETGKRAVSRKYSKIWFRFTSEIKVEQENYHKERLLFWWKWLKFVWVNQLRVLFQGRLWFGQNLCKTTHDMMKLAKTIRSENP